MYQKAHLHILLILHTIRRITTYGMSFYGHARMHRTRYQPSKSKPVEE